MLERKLKPVAVAVGTVFAAALAASAVAEADGDLFAVEDLESGYDRLADAHGEGGCGEGKCGESEGEKEEGSCGEGECGEGKCGEGEGDKEEGSCGEGSCGEGEGEGEESAEA